MTKRDAKDEKKAPKLRFKGFTDDWEQQKFKDLFVERRDKTVKENEDILLSCAISGIYLNSELFSHFRGSSTIGYLKVKKNDLILSAQNLHLGNVNVNLRFDHGIISPAYKVFEIQNASPYFVQAWMKRDATKNFFLKSTTEGASQCRKNIEWKSLYNQKIRTPSKSEQKKVGELFQFLDRTITLHEEKQKQLEQLKKALLQKMFADISLHPEVRFEGFSEPWVQYKVSDIASVIDPHPSHRAPKEVNGGIPFIGIGDVNELGEIVNPSVRKVDLKIYDEHHERYDLSKPSLGIGRVASLGKVIRLRNDIGKYAISPTLAILQILPEFNVDFVYACMNSGIFQKHFVAQSSGSTRQSVGIQDLRRLSIYLPKSLKEQEKIGNLFLNLDRIITSHQQRIDQLTNLKQALLQQMFI
jgi:type I restriction enzyme S subunit